MILEFDEAKIIKNISGKTEDALVVVAALGAGFVSKQIRKNKSIVTSNLINSITYSTNKVQRMNAGKTDGQMLEKPERLTAKIGTTVVYAARVEFGFIGKDSLGRTYNQAAKSFLRVGLLSNKMKLQKAFNKFMKLQNKGTK